MAQATLRITPLTENMGIPGSCQRPPPVRYHSEALSAPHAPLQLSPPSPKEHPKTLTEAQGIFIKDPLISERPAPPRPGRTPLRPRFSTWEALRRHPSLLFPHLPPRPQAVPCPPPSPTARSPAWACSGSPLPRRAHYASGSSCQSSGAPRRRQRPEPPDPPSSHRLCASAETPSLTGAVSSRPHRTDTHHRASPRPLPAAAGAVPDPPAPPPPPNPPPQRRRTPPRMRAARPALSRMCQRGAHALFRKAEAAAHRPKGGSWGGLAVPLQEMAELGGFERNAHWKGEVWNRTDRPWLWPADRPWLWQHRAGVWVDLSQLSRSSKQVAGRRRGRDWCLAVCFQTELAGPWEGRELRRPEPAVVVSETAGDGRGSTCFREKPRLRLIRFTQQLLGPMCGVPRHFTHGRFPHAVALTYVCVPVFYFGNARDTRDNCDVLTKIERSLPQTKDLNFFSLKFENSSSQYLSHLHVLVVHNSERNCFSLLFEPIARLENPFSRASLYKLKISQHGCVGVDSGNKDHMPDY